MADRTPRAVDLRENSARPASWKPPSILPDPEPQEGYTFRWVRLGAGGQADNTNVSKQFREGWAPVRAEDHPELHVLPDHGTRFPGNVVVGDLMLCKAPKEFMEQRAKHYEDAANANLKASDNNLFQLNDSRAPLLTPERKSQTKFGSGARD